MSAKRINITIDEDAADKLLEMAGSERKQGEFVGELVAAEWAKQRGSPEALNERLEYLEKVTATLAKLLVNNEFPWGIINQSVLIGEDIAGNEIYGLLHKDGTFSFDSTSQIPDKMVGECPECKVAYEYWPDNEPHECDHCGTQFE